MSKLTNFLICLLTVFTMSLPQAIAREMLRPHQSMPKKLLNFDSCQALENHLSQGIVRYQGIQYRYYGNKVHERRGRELKEELSIGAGMAEAEPAESFQPMNDMAAPMQKKSKAGPARTTGTNNQVDGVDEADFVKFNGRHIFQLTGNTLKIIQAWPADRMKLISSLHVGGQVKDLLLNGDTVVVISQNGQNLRTSIISGADVNNPKVLTHFDSPGQYMTARMTGKKLIIVNRDHNSYLNVHRVISKAKPVSNTWFNQESVESNSKKVSLKDLMHVRETRQHAGEKSRKIDTVSDCKNIAVSETVAPSSLTRIISIDLSNKSYKETLAFISPSTVYASANSLYLAHTGQDFDSEANYYQQKTALHKFNIQKSQAKYIASGAVNGHLINQFALDEHRGFLRVATNGTEYIKPSWFGDRKGSGWKTINRVQVLETSGKDLQVIGKTRDLAEGERIYSVRFNGDKGYMVTFRQVDPLFTLDLSNPRKPKAVGELKIPGFSTYIHTLGKNHLLAIGKDADPRTGRAKGLKLSIFDVSDFANPKEVKNFFFNRATQSEASYEHKAFSFYREKGILAIPVHSNQRRSKRYAKNHGQTALLLFKVTNKDIKPAGEMNMSGVGSGKVRRSFFADNFVYAIANAGIRAAKISEPSKVVSTVLFNSNEIAWTW